MARKQGQFRLRELIAIGVGGMIGGRIFSVLGLAVNMSGHAAPFSFLIGGLIALSAGYSYVKYELFNLVSKKCLSNLENHCLTPH